MYLSNLNALVIVILLLSQGLLKVSQCNQYESGTSNSDEIEIVSLLISNEGIQTINCSVDLYEASKCECKDCTKTVVGSHTWSIVGKRCDSCYRKRQRALLGNHYFCSNCNYGASGDIGKSFALNDGLCDSCFSYKEKHKENREMTMKNCDAVKKCYKRGY